MFRFFKHNDTWRYRNKSEEQAYPVTADTLELFLGVGSVHETRVKVPQPDGKELYVTVVNGFITKVEHFYEENAYYDEENEVGAYIATRVVEQTEFYVKKDFT